MVQVDDLFRMGDGGDGDFFQQTDKLRERAQFGKFVFLQETHTDPVQGRRVQQPPSFELKIDMEKFIKTA